MAENNQNETSASESLDFVDLINSFGAAPEKPAAAPKEGDFVDLINSFSAAPVAQPQPVAVPEVAPPVEPPPAPTPVATAPTEPVIPIPEPVEEEKVEDDGVFSGAKNFFKNLLKDNDLEAATEVEQDRILVRGTPEYNEAFNNFAQEYNASSDVDIRAGAMVKLLQKTDPDALDKINQRFNQTTSATLARSPLGDIPLTPTVEEATQNKLQDLAIEAAKKAGASALTTVGVIFDTLGPRPTRTSIRRRASSIRANANGEEPPTYKEVWDKADGGIEDGVDVLRSLNLILKTSGFSQQEMGRLLDEQSGKFEIGRIISGDAFDENKIKRIDDEFEAGFEKSSAQATAALYELAEFATRLFDPGEVIGEDSFTNDQTLTGYKKVLRREPTIRPEYWERAKADALAEGGKEGEGLLGFTAQVLTDPLLFLTVPSGYNKMGVRVTERTDSALREAIDSKVESLTLKEGEAFSDGMQPLIRDGQPVAPGEGPSAGMRELQSEQIREGVLLEKQLDLVEAANVFSQFKSKYGLKNIYGYESVELLSMLKKDPAAVNDILAKSNIDITDRMPARSMANEAEVFPRTDPRAWEDFAPADAAGLSRGDVVQIEFNNQLQTPEGLSIKDIVSRDGQTLVLFDEFPTGIPLENIRLENVPLRGRIAPEKPALNTVRAEEAWAEIMRQAQDPKSPNYKKVPTGIKRSSPGGVDNTTGLPIEEADIVWRDPKTEYRIKDPRGQKPDTVFLADEGELVIGATPTRTAVGFRDIVRRNVDAWDNERVLGTLDNVKNRMVLSALKRAPRALTKLEPFRRTVESIVDVDKAQPFARREMLNLDKMELENLNKKEKIRGLTDREINRRDELLSKETQKSRIDWNLLHQDDRRSEILHSAKFKQAENLALSRERLKTIEAREAAKLVERLAQTGASNDVMTLAIKLKELGRHDPATALMLQKVSSLDRLDDAVVRAERGDLEGLTPEIQLELQDIANKEGLLEEFDASVSRAIEDYKANRITRKGQMTQIRKSLRSLRQIMREQAGESFARQAELSAFADSKVIRDQIEALRGYRAQVKDMIKNKVWVSQDSFERAMEQLGEMIGVPESLVGILDEGAAARALPEGDIQEWVSFRDKFITQLSAQGGRAGLTDEMVDAVVGITDARARSWAEWNRLSPEQAVAWYKKSLAETPIITQTSKDIAERLSGRDTLIRTDVGEASGFVRYNQEGRAILGLFEQSTKGKNPEAVFTSVVEGLSDVFFRELPTRDMQVVEQWANFSFPKRKSRGKNGKLLPHVSASFSKAFLRHLKTGDLPRGFKNAPGIKEVFGKLKDFITDLFIIVSGRNKGRRLGVLDLSEVGEDVAAEVAAKIPRRSAANIEVKISKDLEEVFNRLLDPASIRGEGSAVVKEIEDSIDLMKRTEGVSRGFAALRLQSALRDLYRAAGKTSQQADRTFRQTVSDKMSDVEAAMKDIGRVKRIAVGRSALSYDLNRVGAPANVTKESVKKKLEDDLQNGIGLLPEEAESVMRTDYPRIIKKARETFDELVEESTTPEVLASRAPEFMAAKVAAPDVADLIAKEGRYFYPKKVDGTADTSLNPVYPVDVNGKTRYITSIEYDDIGKVWYEAVDEGSFSADPIQPGSGISFAYTKKEFIDDLRNIDKAVETPAVAPELSARRPEVEAAPETAPVEPLTPLEETLSTTEGERIRSEILAVAPSEELADSYANLVAARANAWAAANDKPAGEFIARLSIRGAKDEDEVFGRLIEEEDIGLEPIEIIGVDPAGKPAKKPSGKGSGLPWQWAFATPSAIKDFADLLKGKYRADRKKKVAPKKKAAVRGAELSKKERAKVFQEASDKSEKIQSALAIKEKAWDDKKLAESELKDLFGLPAITDFKAKKAYYLDSEVLNKSAEEGFSNITPDTPLLANAFEIGEELLNKRYSLRELGLSLPPVEEIKRLYSQVKKSDDDWQTAWSNSIKEKSNLWDEYFDQDFLRTTNGIIVFGEQEKALIFLFESARPGTLGHELGHFFRRDLPEDLQKRVSDWAEKTSGFPPVDGRFSIGMEEAFAEAFELYLKTGTSPVPELTTVFARFKKWLGEILTPLIASGKIKKLDPEIRAIFDEMLGAQPRPVPKQPRQVKVVSKPKKAKPPVFDEFLTEYLGKNYKTIFDELAESYINKHPNIGRKEARISELRDFDLDEMISISNKVDELADRLNLRLGSGVRTSDKNFLDLKSNARKLLKAVHDRQTVSNIMSELNVAAAGRDKESAKKAAGVFRQAIDNARKTLMIKKEMPNAARAADIASIKPTPVDDETIRRGREALNKIDEEIFNREQAINRSMETARRDAKKIRDTANGEDGLTPLGRELKIAEDKVMSARKESDLSQALEKMAPGSITERPRARFVPDRSDPTKDPNYIAGDWTEFINKQLDELPETKKSISKAAEDLGYDLRSPGEIWSVLTEARKYARSYGDELEVRRRLAIDTFKADEELRIYDGLDQNTKHKVQSLLNNRGLYGVSPNAPDEIKQLAKSLGMTGNKELFVTLKKGRVKVADEFTNDEILQALKVAKIVDEVLDLKFKQLKQAGVFTSKDPVLLARIDEVKSRILDERDPEVIKQLNNEVKELESQASKEMSKEDFLRRVDVASYIPHIKEVVSLSTADALASGGFVSNKNVFFEKYRSMAGTIDDVNEMKSVERAISLLYHNASNATDELSASLLFQAGSPLEKFNTEPGRAILRQYARGGILQDLFSVEEWDALVKWSRKTLGNEQIDRLFSIDLPTIMARYMRTAGGRRADAIFNRDIYRIFPQGEEIAEFVKGMPKAEAEQIARSYGFSRMSRVDSAEAATGISLPKELRDFEQLNIDKLKTMPTAQVVDELAGVGVVLTPSQAHAFLNAKDIYAPTPFVDYMKWINAPDYLSSWPILKAVIDAPLSVAKGFATIASLAHVFVNVGGNYASIAQKIGTGVFDVRNHFDAMAIFTKMDDEALAAFKKSNGVDHEDYMVKIGRYTLKVKEWRDVFDKMGISEAPLSKMYLEDIGGVGPRADFPGVEIASTLGFQAIGGLGGFMFGGPLGAAALSYAAKFPGSFAGEMIRLGYGSDAVKQLQANDLKKFGLALKEGWKRASFEEFTEFVENIKLQRGAKESFKYFAEKSVGMTTSAALMSVFGEPGIVAGALAGTGVKSHMKMMTGLNQAAETQARITLAVGELRRGKSLQEAADSVDYTLRNYSHLTPFEKFFLRRLFFFYTWEAGNMRFQLKQAIKHPRQMAIFTSYLDAAQRGAFEESQFNSMPTNIRHSLTLGLFPGKYMSIPGLGQMSLIDTVGRFEEEGAFAAVVPRLNPLLNGTIEYIAGQGTPEKSPYSFFYGRSVKDMNNAARLKNADPITKSLVGFPQKLDPATGKYVPSPTEVDFYRDGKRVGMRDDFRMQNPEMFYLLQKLPGNRPYLEALDLAAETYQSVAVTGEPIPPTPLERGMRVFGLKVRTFDPDATDYFRRRSYMQALERAVEAADGNAFKDNQRARYKIPQSDVGHLNSLTETEAIESQPIILKPAK